MPEVRTVRVASESPVALICFIVATVALLVVCYIFYDANWRKGVKLLTLEAGLEKSVEQPFKDANESLTMETSTEAKAKFGAYGAEFFNQLAQTTKRGLEFKDIAKFTGLPAESLTTDLKKLLDEAGASTVKELVARDKEKIEAQGKELKTAKETEKKLLDQVQAEKEAGSKAIQDKIAENEKLTKQVADKDSEMKTLRDEMKSKLDAAQEQVSKAEKEYSEKRGQLDEEKKAFVAKLDAEIKELKDYLAKMNRKVPERIEGPSGDEIKQRIARMEEMVAVILQPTALQKQAQAQEGKIMDVDRDQKRAYINIGTVDGVKNGALYIVYEIGKAGKRIEKGEVEVVNASDVTSTVAIVKSQRINPILAGDIVMVKPPEVAAKPVPKAAKTPPPLPAPAPKGEEGEKATEGKKEEKKEGEKAEEGKKEEKEEPKAKKEGAEEKKPEGKEEGEKKSEEPKGKAGKKAGAGPDVKDMMKKLGMARKAIQGAMGAKNFDVMKSKADEIAEAAKMGADMEGMPEAEVPMYKTMGDAAGELSAAAEKKSAGDVMAAMKKVEGSCQGCHAKYKK